MDMLFRIEQRDAFRVIGYQLHTTNQKKEGRKAIPAFWETFRQHKAETLMQHMNQAPMGVFGINRYQTDPMDARKFDYMIAVASLDDPTDDMCEYIVPAMMWAVFPCSIETMGKTEVMAISKWLPKSTYRALNKGYLTGRMKAQAPDIEYYGKDDVVEVWIAVEPK